VTLARFAASERGGWSGTRDGRRICARLGGAIGLGGWRWSPEARTARTVTVAHPAKPVARWCGAYMAPDQEVAIPAQASALRTRGRLLAGLRAPRAATVRRPSGEARARRERHLRLGGRSSARSRSLAGQRGPGPGRGGTPHAHRWRGGGWTAGPAAALGAAPGHFRGARRARLLKAARVV
jgi:hypothetical protein